MPTSTASIRLGYGTGSGRISEPQIEGDQHDSYYAAHHIPRMESPQSPLLKNSGLRTLSSDDQTRGGVSTTADRVE